jgi:hypothetical protein
MFLWIFLEALKLGNIISSDQVVTKVQVIFTKELS